MKLSELLEIKPGITALIGGGGKTTLMYRLAAELREKGSVLLCTTTKIWPPEHLTVVQDAESLRAALAEHGIACAGTPTVQGKLTEPSFPWQQAADYILVEADGSAGRPMKAHEKHEPVLPEKCRNTILVLGADGFGKPIRAAAHRPSLYAHVAGVTEEHLVTAALAAKVICCENLQQRIFVNQVEGAEKWSAAREFSALMNCPVAAGSLHEGYWEKIQ